ncbi:MAG TPA: glutamate formimidoyltransferase [Anaerolineae bacterium]|nr:glutamate formimidoyltransferase [Anaerolineae bacterium]HNU06042.1 glutamate formimidoyltransferase [Anaerolineae bacterium]
MQQIVECVPNFSEGRRQEVIDAIVAAIVAVPGTKMLDVQSDADHNRTVVTFVGEPEAALEGAFQGARQAAALIDLNVHRGEHPRMGATDVIPFIPVRGVSMEECVALARRLGQRIGEELAIPVYLYAKAATRPERESLPAVRKGEFEGLRELIGSDPGRVPDFGPSQMGPAGATAVGARPFLIAFNVYLNTADVEIAKKIAKTLRFSSGGLRYVQAMGVLVEGQAQVSMNLTDYRQTAMPTVLEMVRREAARYGALVVRSELVGMLPQQALVDAACWYLQLDGFTPDQVLENRLAGA